MAYLSYELLKYIDNQTCDLIYKAIQDDILAIQYAKVFDEKICECVASSNYKLIKYIPKEYMTENLMLISLKSLCMIDRKSGKKLINVINPPQHILLKLALEEDDEYIRYLIDYDYNTAKKFVTKYPYSLKYIKPVLIDYELCKIAVSGNYRCIEYVPDKFYCDELIKIILNKPIFNLHFGSYLPDNINPDLFEKLIEKNSSVIKNIKNPTRELIVLSIKKNPNNIRHVVQDYDLAVMAVSDSPKTIKHVKLELIDDDMCNLIFDRYQKVIKYMKNPTYDQQVRAVKKNGQLIKYIKNQTYNVCLEAIKQNYSAIKYVDDNILTEIIDEIFEYYPHLIIGNYENKIPENTIIKYIERFANAFEKYSHVCDYEKSLEMVKFYGNNLKFVRKDLIDYNICYEAIINKGSIKYVPESYITYELCKIAVEDNPYCYKYIPLHMLDRSLCLKIISECDDALFNIDKNILDDELITKSILLFPESIKFITRELPNYQKYVELAISSDPTSVRYVDNKYITRSMWMDIIKKNGDLLQYIEDQDYELCIEAIKSIGPKDNNISRLEYVKDNKTKKMCIEQLVTEYIKFLDSI